MNMIEDVKEFKKLSILYREAHNNIDKQNKIEKNIKFLVDGTVQRMSSAFNIKLNQEVKKIGKNMRGTLMPSHTFQQIQSRPHIRVQDFMYLHKKSVSKMNGINLLLDYSGSEWFNDKYDTIEDVQRIYIQNFLALCISKYAQDVSRDKVRVVIHAFGKTPIKILDTDDMSSTSWEGMYVHNMWGSGARENINLLPRALKNHFPMFTHSNWKSWFDCERIRDAFNVSLDTFKKMNMSKFITLFLTDGGISEFGYGSGTTFVENSIIKMEQRANESKMAFVFIKTQSITTKDLLEKIGISLVEILKKSDYNNAFLNISNLINGMM